VPDTIKQISSSEPIHRNGCTSLLWDELQCWWGWLPSPCKYKIPPPFLCTVTLRKKNC